ncbi:uncharacterized protein [Epargyreus clarus]|uniref:uncharacterized protein n=1 Tax=Epargyreus clarus TaxID=520877 RepID=UPI003C2B0295
MAEDGTFDPGGPEIPQVGANIIIHNESSMDTDSSIRSERKRVKAARKFCKNCNKKKRTDKSKHHNNSNRSCMCLSEESSGNEKKKHRAHKKVDISSPPLESSPADVCNTSNLEVSNTQDTVSTEPTRRIRYYIATDNAPFLVHVQKVTQSLSDGATLHPITFGNFLKKNNNVIKNIVNGSLKRIGRNRISMAFANYEDANKFVLSPLLEQNKLKAFIPSFNVTRVGIVKGVPSEWSEEEIKSNISVPIGCGEVINMRRLNYKVIVEGSPVWKPSQSVVLTFDGQILPKRIFMCYNSLSVELYIYPTIQCYNCCKYGHTKVHCRSKPRCYKCGQEHTGDTCSVSEINAYCCSCSGPHFAINKCCPEFERQKRIKLTMAQSCMSYLEASKIHPPISRSYAEVLLSEPNTLHSESILSTVPHSSTNTSTKKTIFLKPRAPPKQVRGYDKLAHNSLIKDYNPKLSAPNGSAIAKSTIEHFSVKDIINELINTLIKLNIVKPDNAAFLINEMNNAQNQDGQVNQHSPMELPQHS